MITSYMTDCLDNLTGSQSGGGAVERKSMFCRNHGNCSGEVWTLHTEGIWLL